MAQDDKKYSIHVLFEVLDKFSKPLKELSDKFGKVSKETKGLKNDIANLNAAAKSLKSFGKKMSLYVTAPLTALGVFSAKSAMDFNSLMSEIGTSIPGNLVRLKELRTGAQDVAMEFGKGTKDIGEGLREVVRSFGEGADTMDKLRLAAKAARAGFATTAQTVDLATGSMRAYGETSTESMKKFLNLAIFAKTKGKASFHEVATAMGRLLPIAASMQIMPESVMAAFTTLTELSPNSVSRVGFQLSTLLESLAKFPKLVQSVKEVGFEETLLRLKKALKGNITALRQVVGGARSLGGAADLMGKGWGKFVELLKEMKLETFKIDESFKEVAFSINKTGYSWDRFKARIEVVKQRLGEALLPSLEKVLKPLSSMVDVLNNLSDAQKTWMIGVSAGAAAIGPLSIGIGTLVTGFTALWATGIAFKTFGIPAILTSIAGSFGALKAAVFAAVPLLTIFALKFGVIIGLGALAAKTFNEMSNNWRSASYHLGQAGEGIKILFGPAVTKAMEPVSNFFVKIGDAIANAAKWVWNLTKAVSSFLKIKLFDKIGKMTSWFKETFKIPWGENVPARKKVFDFKIDKPESAWSKYWGGIKGEWKKGQERLKFHEGYRKWEEKQRRPPMSSGVPTEYAGVGSEWEAMQRQYVEKERGELLIKIKNETPYLVEPKIEGMTPGFSKTIIDLDQYFNVGHIGVGF